MYSYEEVLDQIENGRRFGNRPGVEITGIMLEQMGQPQNGMPFIHVAGTNGKGSVCAFLTSVFRETGLKVGTFISPHLIDFEERIMVDGRQISREDVFDYCVLMAVLYFKEQNCDLVIMETGLGGRLDSTNALGNPVVSVITRIGYDHMNILGNTIEEIAQEKAGIIKAGVPVVIAPQESEAEGKGSTAGTFGCLSERKRRYSHVCGTSGMDQMPDRKREDENRYCPWNSQSGMAGAYGNFKYRTVSDGGWCTQQ